MKTNCLGVVRFITVGSAALCILIAGCGPAKPPSAEVTGTVTYNGAPVTNATVTFYPDSGVPATGATDAAGKFTLSASPGGQKIAVNPVEELDANAIAGDPDATPTPPPFPEKYRNMESSGLTANVELGQANSVTLELTD